MGMSTQEYWAEIDAERAAKRDKLVNRPANHTRRALMRLAHVGER